jgi:predicted nucleic acid-binding protein
VTRAYLDTNYLFGLLRQGDAGIDPAFAAWRERVESEIGPDAAVVSDLLVDELTYRLVLAWLRDSGDPVPLDTFRKSGPAVMKRMRSKLVALWKALHDLDLDWAHSRTSSRHIAQALMGDPGLPPRDAFHAAYAIDGECQLIVSSDSVFDRVPRLTRMGP